MNRVESGWILLCIIFKPLGFFTMIAFLALFNCVFYYQLIKKYVPIKYYWLAVFVYVFSPGFMLIHASAMRQSVAIAIFIFSLKYIYNKDIIRYFICIVIASLFHTSALILLPVILLGILNWKIRTVSIITIISIFISLFMFSNEIAPYMSEFISKYFDRYEMYEGAGKIGSGIGVLYLSILFFLALYYEKYQDRENSIIFKLAIIGFMFIPLGMYIQLIGRVGMYFTPATIAVYPIIQMNMKKPIYRTYYILLVIVTVYTFITFFQSDLWSNFFGVYHTIFSSDVF